jgi:adenylate cyclase
MKDDSHDNAAERFESLGIFDPASPDADDHLRLLGYLVAHGAREAQLIEAAREQRLGGLALDLALSSGMVVSFADAVSAAGLRPEVAARLWRALGFPDPVADPPRVPSEAVQVLRFMGATVFDVLGADTTLALARVTGTATSRLAEAVVDAFRVRVEVPLRTQGRPYSHVVEDYARLAVDLLPQFLDALGSIFRRHLVAVASGRWSLDEEGATPQRQLVVGFVDLVGYTALSRTLSPRQLAERIGRFEAVVEDVVATHGGRLVKLLGDGAMFVSDDASVACRLALDMLAGLAAEPELPAARIGLAAGKVVAVNGDYQGPVVNVAARLLGAAPPATVAVDESVRRAAAAFRFDPHQVAAFKGFPSPPPIFLLREGSGASLGQGEQRRS